MLVAAAIAKVQRGQQPSAAERKALREFEAEQEESRRWQYYATCPKSHYLLMSGRAAKVVLEQAERHGLPYPRLGKRKTPVDLAAVIRWLHDFLAAHKTRLAAPHTDDPLLAGGTSPALEDYRRERTKLARLERMQKEASLLPRDVVHQSLARWAGILRSAGEALSRQFGAEARQIMDEALDDAERDIQNFFSSPSPDDQ